MTILDAPDISVRINDQLPAITNLREASESTLKRFGVPVGSNDERRLIDRTLTRLGSEFQIVRPELAVGPPKSHRSLRKGKRTQRNDRVRNSEQSNNWAGVSIYVPTLATTFKWITTEFTVPNAVGGGFSSHWIGLDGNTEDSAGQQLCQMGVECNGAVKGGVAETSVWFEWVPGPSITISNQTFVSPGDLVGLTICTSGPGATSATGLVSNLTTKQVISPFQFTAPPGISLTGETAEWISERPTDASTGQLLPLAGFGMVVFCSSTAGMTDGSAQAAAQYGLTEMRRSNTDDTLICEAACPAPGIVQTLWMSES